MDAPTSAPADPALPATTTTPTAEATPRKRKHQEVASPNRQRKHPKADRGKYADFPHTRVAPGPYWVLDFIEHCVAKAGVNK